MLNKIDLSLEEEMDWVASGSIDKAVKKAGVSIFMNWDSVVGTKITKSCDTTNASDSVIVPNLTGLKVGDYVTGAGIPDGTKILVLTDATNIQLDAAATATGTGTTLTFEQIDGHLLIEFLHQNDNTGVAEIISKTELYTDATETTVYSINTHDNQANKNPLFFSIDFPLIAYKLVYTKNGIVSGNARFTDYFKSL